MKALQNFHVISSENPWTSGVTHQTTPNEVCELCPTPNNITWHQTSSRRKTLYFLMSCKHCNWYSVYKYDFMCLLCLQLCLYRLCHVKCVKCILDAEAIICIFQLRRLDSYEWLGNTSFSSDLNVVFVVVEKRRFPCRRSISNISSSSSRQVFAMSFTCHSGPKFGFLLLCILGQGCSIWSSRVPGDPIRLVSQLNQILHVRGELLTYECFEPFTAGCFFWWFLFQKSDRRLFLCCLHFAEVKMEQCKA